MKNTYVVTGATGFVGANLVRSLVGDGQMVHVLVRNKRLNWRLSDISEKLLVHEADLVRSDLSGILHSIRPDVVFHLASYGVPPKEDDPLTMTDVNVKGVMRLVDAVKDLPMKLFVNTGSAVEYGVKNEKMKETDLLEPINDYGITKAAGTLYCQKEGIRHSLPIVTFRLFTPYGYWEEGSRLVPSVILDALSNRPIEVSVPTSVRDFVCIDDVVSVFRNAVEITHKPGAIYNIGSGTQHSVRDVVETVLSVTRSISEVAWGTKQKQARFIEPKLWEADIRKTANVFGWKPKHSLKQGISKTVDWFRKHRKLYQ